eukprot:GHUV01019370.1.p1 GENE.GHUV01019370.1~~GHUV01019370.1.p1  ORF type:complete len:374 (+),score=126.28 GHUV01019370.1:171-1292(+)
MQQYAKAAKELLDNVAKLTIRQDGAPRPPAPIILQASSSAEAPRPYVPIELRVSQFKQELLASRINLDDLRRLAYQGIPDRDGLRAMTWKLLLGYLPPDPSEWDELLARKRTEYLLFCEDLIVDPKKKKQKLQQLQQQQELQQSQQGSSSSNASEAANSSSTSNTAGDPLSQPSSSSSTYQHSLNSSRDNSSNSNSNSSSSRSVDDPLSGNAQLKADVPEDHPLSLQSTSTWHTYFKDNEIMEQIDRDVMRTHPDMHFFSGDTEEAEQHRREMKRCLFMFAKLNPGLRYIQGMNELLAPVYYMFKTDPDTTSARYAEADSFYCFVDLISEFRDHFCQQLDNSSSGIKATISKLVELLHVHDPQLAEHIEKNKV